MKFVWTVAWRLMREGRFQSLLILAGVTIGVAVVVYITAVVNGLQANIIEKTLSTQAHIVLKPREDRNRRLIDLPARELMTEIETRTQRENTIDDWERRRQVATGIAGAVMATPLLNVLRITDRRARGFAVGLAFDTL